MTDRLDQLEAYKAYKGKGLSGLANMGNTCYVNACLQMLSHTYELNDFLSKNGGEYRLRLNHKVDSVLLHEWDKLRVMLWSGNCIISPGGFVSSMQKIAKLKRMDLFSGFQQNDVAEFIGFLLDCFHNALAREVEMKVRGVARNATDRAAQECYQMMASMYKKQYSEVLNIFYGVHVSIIEPLQTMQTMQTAANPVALSTKPEPFCILNVSIPAAKTPNAVVTLFDCLDHHCAPEVLSGENAWFNEATGQKQDVYKRLSFWSLPNVLIVVLKRRRFFKIRTRLQSEELRVRLVRGVQSPRRIAHGRPLYRHHPERKRQLVRVQRHRGEGSAAGLHYQQFAVLFVLSQN